LRDEIGVELRDVVKRFDTVTAVDHVSLEIRDGEFFSLLGPSGCGKTTSLRMIAGFEMPTIGEIFIGGVPQGYLPPYKRPVNTVFQHYALFPHMTVEQNVAFGLEMTSVPKPQIKRRVKEVLDLVHLTGMDKRRPKQLSGGQQQRVALARALVNHPRVLLLDEPLGALDLKLRKAMQVELKALQTRVGITFIYVTHDQEEALTMSDRIGVMDGGKLLQVGAPEEVYESPHTRFVSDFIGDTNYLDGYVLSSRGDSYEVSIEPGTCVWAKALQDLRPNQRVTVAFRPEKVYLNLEEREEINSLSGMIHDVVYTGSNTTYHIELSNNATLMARQQNIAALPSKQFQTGDRVEVSWPVTCSRAFPNDQ
jgi:spermidine/putrescine transport system ATP-binding protein